MSLHIQSQPPHDISELVSPQASQTARLVPRSTSKMQRRLRTIASGPQATVARVWFTTLGTAFVSCVRLHDAFLVKLVTTEAHEPVVGDFRETNGAACVWIQQFLGYTQPCIPVAGPSATVRFLAFVRHEAGSQSCDNCVGMSSGSGSLPDSDPLSKFALSPDKY